MYDAAAITAWMERAAAAFRAHKDELGALDRAIGDGDHGINLVRGFDKVVARLHADPPATTTAAFKTVAMTLIATVGGASGPLYGTFFLEAGRAAAAASALDTPAMVRCLAAGLAGVRARGKAAPGDKTMVDALTPAIAALEAGAGLPAAVAAAAAGVEATKPMVAHKGRASYLGERAIGHADPGATSSTLLLRALMEEP